MKVSQPKEKNDELSTQSPDCILVVHKAEYERRMFFDVFRGREVYGDEARIQKGQGDASPVTGPSMSQGYQQLAFIYSLVTRLGDAKKSWSVQPSLRWRPVEKISGR